MDEELFAATSPDNLPSLDSLNTPITESVRLEMAEEGSKRLYFLAKVILGYKDLNAKVHLPMCDYYDATRDVYTRRCSLMPRTHYKTTIWTIAESLGDVTRDPNVRILMIADIARNAELFMLECQQHFEHNEVFRWIYKDLIPANFRTARWNVSQMQVPRTIIAREPTIDAIGALGGSESRHYNKIRADDLITEKCIRSDVEMDKVIKWANGLESLLIDQTVDCIDFVGSRKKKGDLYEVQMKSYGEMSEPISIGPFAELHGKMTVFSRHVTDHTNKPIFHQKITAEFLNRLRRIDPERYHSQYANSPKGSGLNTFDEKWLRYYKWSGEAGETISCVHGGEELLSISPWSMDRILLFDPAIAEKQSNCMNAIIVVAKGSGPFRMVLETKIGHYTPDEAIAFLFEMQEKWQPSIQSIEKRGMQGWVKYGLDDKCNYENLPYLPIVEWPPQGDPSGQWAKVEHIRGLQPMVRAGYLWIHEDQVELRDELEFYPNVRWDDGLDALAQGLTYWPMAMDEAEVEGRKLKEIEYLDLISGIPGSADSYKEWDEAAFLAQFDYTGYGMRDA